MKIRIFALAFSVGFILSVFGAALFIFRYYGAKPEEALPEKPAETVFLETESANFLLIFEEEGNFGPFSLVNFDAKTGRIPVFSFSQKAAVDYGGVKISAGKLFSSVSPEVFAGTIETNLGIEISGYLIWNRESAEALIAKAGTFDYILPKDIRYSDGTRYVNLISGVQSMNGKKICDIITNPKFSEGERCDTLSRMISAFFNRRLRRFLPESGVYSVIFNYTKTDISAFDREKYSALIKVLCDSGESLSGHVTNDTEREVSTGLLYFSEGTLGRIKKYFG
ncbi:MAG: LCP family protein [Oscillospiraceae bacterium]|nr:LCP family protein [Oscillospiraceae bacterium]